MRCDLRLPPENNNKIFESHNNKKTVFQKKYKKKNSNNKKETNKPTTNRNVQQFILNRRRRCRSWIESKNHNKRTNLCEEARTTLFLFFYGRSKRRKYCETHGKMTTAHTAYELRALWNESAVTKLTTISSLPGSLGHWISQFCCQAVESRIRTTHTHTHSDTVKRAHTQRSRRQHEARHVARCKYRNWLHLPMFWLANLRHTHTHRTHTLTVGTSNAARSVPSAVRPTTTHEPSVPRQYEKPHDSCFRTAAEAEVCACHTSAFAEH